MSTPTINTSAAANWGTTLLRVVVGTTFLAHGAQKLFVMEPLGLAGFFGSLGIPFPELNAYLVIAVEILGGLAMIAGLGARIVAALFTAVMVVAIATVHAAHGYFLPNGYEFTLLLAAASGTIVLQGAGAFALDNLLRGRSVTWRETSVARA